MLSAHLVRMIERHAEDLTSELLRDLASNPRTPAYHTIPSDELHRRTYDVYHNLGRWLGAKDESPLEATYQALGRARFAEGIALSEVLQALVLVKEHLRAYIRRAGAVESAIELYQEVELNVMISHFFDKAVYHTVRGYEAAAAEAASKKAAR